MVEFAPGDVVVLKDGSPPMTVKELLVESAQVEAWWMTAAGELRKGRFAISALRHARPSELEPLRPVDDGLDNRYRRAVAMLPAGSTWRQLDDDHLIVAHPEHEPFKLNLHTGERTVIKPTGGQG
ncbi:MAG TPA: DUF2158 domain-containing protein [Reyranellaceae bacterium]|nr:DUF2158 domain-containing protein [Reyranellaceae bacterium]